MSITQQEMRVGDPSDMDVASTASDQPRPSASTANDRASDNTDVLYPPGIKLFGDEKRRRDREIAEEVRRHVDPTTGRLRAADAQQVYHDVGRRYGLSASGVILRTPSEIKPTNLETLEFARSQKGKQSPEERAGRPRRRRSARAAQPEREGRKRRRDATVQQRVREAAME
jgi:hypothetical protein